MIYLNFRNSYEGIKFSFSIIFFVSNPSVFDIFSDRLWLCFEADQYCHAYLSSYDNISGNYGCDHDTETHQWILYESYDNKETAKIVKKFRYKFL